MASQAALDLVINLKGADKADTALGKLAKTATSLGKGMASLAKVGFAAAAGGAVALVGGFGAAAVSGLRFNSSMEQTTAKLNAFTKDGAKSAEILEMIRDRAARTPFAFEEMASAASGLLPAAKMANESLESIIETAEVLAASNPAEGLEGAAFAIREAVSGDFASAIERFNLPRSMINKLKEEGVPNLEIVRRAMQEMGYDVSLVSNLAETASGRWSTFMDTLQGLAATATAPLFEGLSSGMATVNQWLTDNNGKLQEFAAWIGERLGAAFTSAIDWISRFAGAMQGINEAFQTGGALQAIQVALLKIGEAFPSVEPWTTWLVVELPAAVETARATLADVLGPAVQGMREGFGLSRDAVITFIQAFTGEWENVPGKIHPVHAAIGDLGLTARSVFDWLTSIGLPGVVAAFERSMPRNQQLITNLVNTIRSELGDGSQKTLSQNMSDFQQWEASVSRDLNGTMLQMQLWGASTRQVLIEQVIPNLQAFLTYWDPTWADISRVVSVASSNIQGMIIGIQSQINLWRLAWDRDWQNLLTTIRSWPADLGTLIGAFTAEAVKLGAAIIGGIVSGITGGAGGIGRAIINAVTGGILAGARAIRAESPSKETMEKIGEPMGQGIAVGVLAQNDFLQKAFVTVIRDAFGAARGELARGHMGGGTQIGPEFVRGLLGDADKTAQDAHAHGTRIGAQWTFGFLEGLDKPAGGSHIGPATVFGFLEDLEKKAALPARETGTRIGEEYTRGVLDGLMKPTNRYRDAGLGVGEHLTDGVKDHIGREGGGISKKLDDFGLRSQTALERAAAAGHAVGSEYIHWINKVIDQSGISRPRFDTRFGGGGDHQTSGGRDDFGGGRAFGGPVVPNRSYIVGERGPEWFVPRSAGTIVPNGANTGTTQHITYNQYVTRPMEPADEFAWMEAKWAT